MRKGDPKKTQAGKGAPKGNPNAARPCEDSPSPDAIGNRPPQPPAYGSANIGARAGDSARPAAKHGPQQSPAPDAETLARTVVPPTADDRMECYIEDLILNWQED